LGTSFLAPPTSKYWGKAYWPGSHLRAGSAETDPSGPLLEIAKIQNTDTTNAGKDVEQQKLSFVAGRNAKWYSHFG